MFLSDRAIKQCVKVGRIVIEPYDEAAVQPASVDLHLGNIFKTGFMHDDGEPAYEIDPRHPLQMHVVRVSGDSYFVLPAGGFCLASTVERIEFPDNIVGRIEGKSSIGRLGLTTHVTAGFFDPGFRGHATLELFNANSLPIRLYPGMRICQMSFAQLSSPAERPYGHGDLGSKYQDQGEEPVESEVHRNFSRTPTREPYIPLPKGPPQDLGYD